MYNTYSRYIPERNRLQCKLAATLHYHTPTLQHNHTTPHHHTAYQQRTARSWRNAEEYRNANANANLQRLYGHARMGISNWSSSHTVRPRSSGCPWCLDAWVHGCMGIVHYYYMLAGSPVCWRWAWLVGARVRACLPVGTWWAHTRLRPLSLVQSSCHRPWHMQASTSTPAWRDWK